MPVDTDPTRGLGVALVGPRLVTAGMMQSRSMVTEAVYFATAQTGSAAYGQITRTGTVQVTHLGALYLPAPMDRLVIDLGGARHEFRDVEAIGDASQMFAANWLAAPHRLSYSHCAGDEGEVRIQEAYDGRVFTAHVEG